MAGVRSTMVSIQYRTKPGGPWMGSSISGLETI